MFAADPKRQEPVAACRKRNSFALIGLLLGSLLVGLAQVAQLPPWEGFDETAHFSYLQQLAETGTWPRFGDPPSMEVDAYLTIAPGPASMKLPLTHEKFFASAAEIIERAREFIHDRPQAARTWRPGGGVNWQAQHPPLYYAALTPAYNATRSWSLAAQLFVLRGISYVFAWTALCLVVFTARKMDLFGQPFVGWAAALWPAIFPSWFPEMARLGNDSLVCLLCACLWITLVKILRDSSRLVAHHAALGLFLGLALLTKATFFPLACVCGGILAFRVLEARADARRWRMRARHFALTLLLACAVCGWWYLHKFYETGSVIGSHDVTMLNKAGGLLQGLEQHASLYAVAKVPWLLGISFLWSGTWSFVLPPRPAMLALAFCAVLLASGYVAFVLRRGPGFLGFICLAVLAAFVAALMYFSLVLMALKFIAPAWYLHSLAPLFALLLAHAIRGLTMMPGSSLSLRLVCYLPLAFLTLAFCIQALFFSGCGTQQPALAYYDMMSAWQCARDLSTVYDHLAVLSFPLTSFSLFAAGLGMMVVSIRVPLRFIRSPQAQSHQGVL